MAAPEQQTGVVGMDDAKRLFSASTFKFFWVSGGVVDVVVVGTTSEREREGGGSGCVSRWGPPVQWCLLGFGGGWARQSEAKRGRKKEGEERESERKKKSSYGCKGRRVQATALPTLYRL